MKYGLLVYNTLNIGDDIQSLAVKEFLPRIDNFIERDNLSKFKSKDKVKLILNGWFTHNPYSWVPSKSIIPLFISFHGADSISDFKVISNTYNSIAKLSSIFEKKLVKNVYDEKFIDYYKQFQPIGSRDLVTLKNFQRLGVDAYFSGCLTLTFKNKFQKRNNKIIFVDPFGRDHLYNLKALNKVKEKIPSNLRNNISLISHWYFSLNHIKRLNHAQNLINEYSKASLVITSRLHCATVCLALETPFIFIDTGHADSRLSGLKDFFCTIKKDDFLNKNYNIDWFNLPHERPNIDSIKTSLIETCQNFINKNETN